MSEFILESAGAAAARVGNVDFDSISLDVLTPYYNAWPTTIYGRSNEIQRNVLAKQVLRLASR